MKKIEIYDPAMCCDSGVCGPSIDPELLRVSFIVKNLENKNYPITRHNLSSDPQAFVDNSEVNEMLTSVGVNELPYVFLDDKLMMTNRYPTNEEVAKWTGLEISELTKKPKVRLSLHTKGGGL
ncbi:MULTISPECIES: arsenite efflux transporter metallochaperone ArsD [unclassified Rummeliibacillus]|uniref:arsenite efflux transporter metallochaperone ArsD n=1 Tax=unclassified Rummeliibacillus TaxID=2622809 RepID=UPI000E667C72|nr:MULTISPECIES: arsenite efflux transporter metallochaperone ArsD [unclassified Rummeliibacillus]RIJ64525.1 arsenical resistance operon transcriptional repressor ArsD [Rummeliibacillus sp. POC4]RPJ96408.1 arsenical resistance operon transcriptional repressor ArsD [Rummeliibacillus sp. TYF005]